METHPRELEIGSFGGKHSSFEKLSPMNTRDATEGNAATSDTRDPEGQGSILTRPKAFRPPATRCMEDYHERSRSSEEDRQDHSPMGTSGSRHKSAWRRVGKSSPTSSPERNSDRNESAPPDKLGPAHQDQADQHKWRNQRKEYTTDSKEHKPAPAQDAPLPWSRHTDPHFPQHSDFTARPDQNIHSERLWEASRMQDRDLPNRPPAEKADSGRTQSSRETTHSSSPSPGRTSKEHPRDAKYEELAAPRRSHQGRSTAPPVDYRAMLDGRDGKLEKGGQGGSNGRLSMLRDAECDDSAALSQQLRAAPHLMPSKNSGLQQSASTTQVYKLLEEVLRGQQTAASNQLVLSGHEGPLPPGASPGMPSPYSNFPPTRYHSVDPYRPAMSYQGGTEFDMLNKLATHRWAPGMGQGEGLLPSGSINPQYIPHISANLSSVEHQALMQALQQKQQAHEMEALANITIQAILSGGANREAAHSLNLRKRKMGELYEPPSKRHSSLISEGDLYPAFSNSPQQICAECGTTNTPTWRRSGKHLMCNACGLRRSRSNRSARPAVPPIGGQHDALPPMSLMTAHGPGQSLPGYEPGPQPRQHSGPRIP